MKTIFFLDHLAVYIVRFPAICNGFNYRAVVIEKCHPCCVAELETL